jgi:hypothetical protein
LRALQLARALVELGHAPTLVAPGSGGTREEAGVRTVTVRYGRASAPLWALGAALAGRPAQAGVHLHPALGRAVEALARESDLVILQLARLGALLPRAAGRPVVVDLVDSLALNFARRAEFERAGLAPIVRLEARRLAVWERKLVERSRAAWLVSERDRAWLAGRLPAALADRLATLNLVVEPCLPPRRPRAAGNPTTLALTGNLDYFPTREGAVWWLREVWPALAGGGSHRKLIVAGSRPAGSLRRAVAGAGGILIENPADLGAILSGADVALVPLRAGSGVPLKLLEAWAAGTPVVTTAWSAAGAGGEPGRDHLAAETVEDWAGAIARLEGDPALAGGLGAGGRARLEADWSAERLRGRLRAALERL